MKFLRILRNCENGNLSSRMDEFNEKNLGCRRGLSLLEENW